MKRVTITIYLEKDEPLLEKLINIADRIAKHPKGKKVLTFYDIEKAIEALKILIEGKDESKKD